METINFVFRVIIIWENVIIYKFQNTKFTVLKNIQTYISIYVNIGNKCEKIMPAEFSENHLNEVEVGKSILCY